MEDKIVLFENGEIKIDVEVMNENVWLTQKQISELFNKNQSVISRHINNIFNSGEIDKKSNMQKMHNANSDKPVEYYALDVILAVGYRVNSKQGIEFRRWASNILNYELYELKKGTYMCFFICLIYFLLI